MTPSRHPLFTLATLSLLLTSQLALAGPLRDFIQDRRAARQQDTVLAQASESGPPSATLGARVLRDIAYGSDPRQRMDVYLPQHPVSGAPVILMVHGGGWRYGNKTGGGVVENKATRWVPKGFIFVSINYRLLPKAGPLEQAEDVARALAFAQSKAASQGGDPAKFILMGHSAGAHLVALVTASPTIAAAQGAKPWLGTVALDGATLNVVETMEGKHYRLHDDAFGTDPAYWKSVSPFHQMAAPAAPLLAVCSTQRDEPCPQARRYVAKATPLGLRAQALEIKLSHADINQLLGQPGPYTDAVESFMASLDPAVMRLLQR